MKRSDDYGKAGLAAASGLTVLLLLWILTAGTGDAPPTVAQANQGTPTPTPTPTPPPVPTGLTATTVSVSQINLAWTDDAGETGYRIHRKKGTTGSWSQIDTVGPNETSYFDTNLAFDTPFTYKIRSYNAYGESDYSATAEATTDPVTLTLTADKEEITTGSTVAYTAVIDPSSVSGTFTWDVAPYLRLINDEEEEVTTLSGTDLKEVTVKGIKTGSVGITYWEELDDSVRVTFRSNLDDMGTSQTLSVYGLLGVYQVVTTCN
jgi:hypothetical protein